MTLKPENQVDKLRFDRMKQTEEEHGRSEQEATDIAARETKELRHREGRSKDESAEPTNETRRV